MKKAAAIIGAIIPALTAITMAAATHLTTKPKFSAASWIVIPKRGSVQVIRFWQAFRDYKHGRDRVLRSAEAELEAAVGVSLRAGA